ncbi:MBL fold metallo-hydrolase [Amycolatopsis orientalis]|uniref:MBL fold metallo-hydrolase n=1 Tax=Amycolatopsis orientalis TaxID=31958 RepID=UPI0003A06848|nr:MBL fold metallo-hydrolase [Amycolatopsis orientalis]
MAHWFDLGDVAVVPLIEDDRLLIEPGEFFPGLEPDLADWYAREPWFDRETGKLVFVIQSFLVCSADEVLVVDACVGAGKDRRRAEFDQLPDRWLRQFRATGVRDVDAVVFTHLHADHVGAVTVGADPVFPHAPHLVVEEEFRYWSSEAGAAAMRRTGDYLADSVRPIERAGQLSFVAPDAVVGKHAELVPAAGHTPGNVCVRVRGSAGTVLLAGDTMHHGVQVRHPELSTRYCVDPGKAAEVRSRILEEAGDSVLLPTHFPAPSAGRARRGSDGYVFEFAADLIRAGQFRYREWLA